MDKQKRNKIAQVIAYFTTYRFSRDTEHRVQDWLAAGEDAEEKKAASKVYWDTLEPAVAPGREAAAWKRINRQIQPAAAPRKRQLYRLAYRVAAVLVPFLMIAGCWWLLNRPADIVLTDLHASNGQIKHITLPDGTAVTLNAGSTLSWPTAFTDSVRRVTLEGEAFFDVITNPEQAFIVSTGDVSIRVTGTSFNVKAYPGESAVTTTLHSGSVVVHLPHIPPVVLTPGQEMAYYPADGKHEIFSVPTGHQAGWITGELTFNNTTGNDIAGALERRYDIQLVRDNTRSEWNEQYTIRYPAGESLEQQLHILAELLGEYSYRTEGNRIIFIPAD